MAKQIEGAHLIELLAHPLQQGGFRLGAVILLQHLPRLGLGLLLWLASLWAARGAKPRALPRRAWALPAACLLLHAGIQAVQPSEADEWQVFNLPHQLMAAGLGEGGLVGAMEPEAEIEPIVTIANGEITGSTIEKIAGTDIWRLVIDISAADGAVVELSAHLAGYDRRLTENWLYQWINKK